MKFGQLMQNCNLVTIHRNTTTGNDITALLQPPTATAAHRPRTGTMLIN